ncbi:uncharacterized protein LOC135500650 [Lineus longissimus]|uniref:uncharacterized protein LOC135500650 n=1 Tax=Lineus longissimus TaxID=88925 RepID=UPI00315D7DBE
MQLDVFKTIRGDTACNEINHNHKLQNLVFHSQQRRIKYDLEKQRIAEENEHRRRKRREIEAAKIRQEEAERRQQQDELVRKRQSQLEEEQKQLEMDEHMKRERENAEKYAQPPDLATVNEDPREDDQEKATPASQQLAEGEVGEVTVKVEEAPPTPADGDAPGDGTVSESVDEAPGEGTEQTDEGGAE